MEEVQDILQPSTLDSLKLIDAIKNLISSNVYNDAIPAENIMLVWYSKTIQNAKMLLYPLGTNDYFEVTLNGDKQEVYIDRYTKTQKWIVPIAHSEQNTEE